MTSRLSSIKQSRRKTISFPRVGRAGFKKDITDEQVNANVTVKDRNQNVIHAFYFCKIKFERREIYCCIMTKVNFD